MAVSKALTNSKAKSFSKPGRYSDGDGLYLVVAKGGSKAWAYMWKIDGRRREMGLGGYPLVTLAIARQRAQQARESVRDGIDPIEARKKVKSEPTFGKCVELFLETMESQWNNDKHRAQWRMTLTDYCKPMAKVRVSEISTDHVMRVLKPIWTTKSETASRLRGRIERVLDFAKAQGWREGDNPAVWRGHLKALLPARSKLSKGHHAALSYKEMPEFMAKLRAKNSISAAALEFLILTAGRTGEITKAVRSEIDHEEKVWTIPAERMKMGKEHRVPLTTRAYELSQRYDGFTNYLFPGGRRGNHLSNMAMIKVLKTLAYDHVTVHGFRSTFRDWAGDKTIFPREIAEQALAHQIGDATEQAYRRSDAIERRRELMETWERFVSGKSADVVELRRVENG